MASQSATSPCGARVKIMDFGLEMVEFALEIMNFVFKTMNFVF